jgi:NTP pyrophosphatase (non-canonical NTP hydrolase)
MTTIEEFYKTVLSKRNGGPEIRPENEPLWTIGLTEEAGEVAGVIKKELYHGHPRDDSKFLSECGDALFYLTCLLYDRGFTLEHAMLSNIEKLKRRYPNGFSGNDSIHRKD